MLSAIALSPFGLGSGAIAAPTSVVVPTVPITRRPTTPVVVPTTPTRTPGNVVLPIYSSPNAPAVILPTPPKSTPSPIVNRPTYAGSNTENGGLVYRVVVASNSTLTKQQVQRVIPDAFSTTVNGRPVIQAGIFREQSKAKEVQQLLNRNNLSAAVLSASANDVNFNPPPSTPVKSTPGAVDLPSVPKSGTVVVIDPGHGGGDPGAIGIRGLQEAEINLDISQQVVALLKQKGVNAMLTRTRDVEIDLEPRVAFAEKANADVFVSIHSNSFDASRTDVSGVETYHYSGGSGQRLAQSVHKNLIRDTGARDRGVKTANFYVIKYTDMPAILVEVGFVTGSDDAARLSSTSGRAKTAQAIAKGILEYLQ